MAPLHWEHPELNKFAVAEEVNNCYTTGKKSKWARHRAVRQRDVGMSSS